MSKKLDLVGKIYGELTVISLDSVKNYRTYWKCQCSCGKLCVIKGKYLTNGDTKSCGHLLDLKYTDDFMYSTKFGLLTPISKKIKNWRTYFTCKCDCGNIIESVKYNLVSGNTKSCGCLTKFLPEEVENKQYGDLFVIKLQSPYCLCKCSCGKEKLIFTTDIISGNKKSCGCLRERKKINNWASKKYTKEHIVYLRRLLSSTHRKQVYKRDSYRCQICSITNNLQMHHIIPIKLNTTEENIFNFDNAITLCRSCHFHIAHGKTTSCLNTEIVPFLLWRVKRNKIKIKE